MKKLLFRWFPKWFTVYVSPERNSVLQIAIVEPKAPILTEALGISKERAIELVKIVEIAIHQNDKSTQAIQNIIEYCNHQNEVVFSIYYLSKTLSEKENPLLKFLR
jgi:hypothetical protein